MISRDNIEEYILSFVDDELSPAEVNELHTFLKNNPEYRGMLEEYQQLTLPEVNQKHLNKEKLLRKERKIVPLWLPLGATGVILLLLGVFISNQYNNSETHDPISHVVSDTSILESSEETPSSPNPVSNQKSMSTSSPSTSLVSSSSSRTTNTKLATIVMPTSHTQTTVHIADISEEIVSPSIDSITEIASLSIAVIEEESDNPLPIEIPTNNLLHAISASSKNELLSVNIKNTQALRTGVSKIKQIVEAYREYRADSNEYMVTINLNRIFN